MIETIRQGLKEDGFIVSISKLCQWFDIPRRTAASASGMPLRPSVTAIRMSLTQRVFRSLKTVVQGAPALASGEHILRL